MSWLLVVNSRGAVAKTLSIIESGAVGDSRTTNTVAIQRAIDRLALEGGGTLTVPKGNFLTGSIFLKPGVDLHLEKGCVLMGSTNIADYPPMPTRIEGHTQVWRPALVNASGCDHLRIRGEGMIRGGGAPFWKAFWTRFRADNSVRNLDVDRPRNIFISDSSDVGISGISLRDSGFWNLHLFRCRGVTVDHVDIRTPPGSPSTDGIDIDSCSNVTVRNSYISVDDDDIALKGNKGPESDRDEGIPPVEHILVTGCTFGLGQGVVTLGSEATHVRDVTVEDCTVEYREKSSNVLARFKLRPDTPQHYEDIRFRNIRMDSKGSLITIKPWTQYFDLKGKAAPSQLVENVKLSNITGRMTSFGKIFPPPNGVIRNLTLADIDLHLSDPKVTVEGVADLTFTNVTINGKPVLPPDSMKNGTSSVAK